VVNGNGQVTVYFAGTGSIFQWEQQSGLSVPIAPTTINVQSLRTDGTRIAFSDGVPSGNVVTASGCGCILNSLDVSQKTETALSTNMTDFAIADGLIAWFEGAVGTGTGTVKSFDGTSITTLSTMASQFYGTGGGNVLFVANKQLVAQTPRGAETLLHSAPSSALISGNYAYYVTGPDNTVYRATLN
jgi:hypothetical protein